VDFTWLDSYLKECRRLREQEEELMKDVKGWELGTYWGEPVFFTRPKNEWHDLINNEYYAHSSYYMQRWSNNFFKWF
jgi:NADH dehydrogenase (ubiquinone) 1 alpha subcomplex subunit 13